MRLIRVISLLLVAGAGLALVRPAAALDMEVRGSQIVLSGDVVLDDDAKFERVLAAAPVARTIVLKNSHGGLLRAGLRIAETIRGRGLNTAVSGYCQSACALIFIAGLDRRSTTDAPPEETSVAFHGAYLAGQNVMGNDPNFIPLFARFTGGRMPADLTSRWMKLPQAGLVVFFDPARKALAKPGTPVSRSSTYVCQGNEAVKVKDCEALPWIDPYDVGIFTSRSPVALVSR